jgi:predicted  nucleic acid-binding Zn-ribbon protein
MVDSIEVRVSALEGEVKEIKVTCKDISERLIRMEETLKNNKYNTVDFKTYNQAFMELSNSVRMLTERVGEVLVKLDKQDERIDILEDADGDKSKKILTWLATTVGAIIIGAIFGIIMKGGM